MADRSKKDILTLSHFVRYVQASYSNPACLNDKKGQEWRAISTEQFTKWVRHLALGLISLGLNKGDRIGILANPSSFWTIASLAIMSVGGIEVPLFANISEDNFLYEIKETKPAFLFVEGAEQWQLYRKYYHLFPKVIDLGEKPEDIEALSFKQVINQGRDLDKAKNNLYEEIGDSLNTEDTAAIIYTSGSTGVPKGAELSHKNIICNTLFNEFHWDVSKDRYLSLLPLAHVFGHCINLWAILWGVSVYYCNDYKHLSQYCREVKPTALVVVPRLLEKVYLKMMDQIQQASMLKGHIATWAFNLAHQPSAQIFSGKLLHRIADHLVYAKLREALGGHVRFVLCGGASLNTHLQQFFIQIGVPIYEGWGLTEACPVCVNILRKNEIGTVGPPILDQQLAVTTEGEVLVRGPLVMKGYYLHPELTEQVIKEKWLHTGDRGKMNENGYLVISGRMKELYKTSTGEYVAPIPIEQSLCQCPFIDMAMIVAEGKKFVSCLLFPNFEMIAKIKSRCKMEHLTNEEFLKGSFIRKEMEKLLNKINQKLNHWEQIHAYRFILDPLTIENGELTPSLKIRREIVAKKYNRIINSIYSEDLA